MTNSIEPLARPAPRLSEVLFRTADKGFGSIAPIPSNVQAIEHSRLFADGGLAFVALIGPSGWGKSHLLEAVATSLRRSQGQGIEVLNSIDWTVNPAKGDPHMPVLLDNVQDSMEKPKLKLQLRLALERRVKSGRPTLLSFTVPRATRVVRSLLPNHRDWVIATIEEPRPCERLLVVEHMMKSEGLVLSNSLKRLLATKLQGNGNTLMGALKRLKLNQSSWLDAQMTLRACGVLNPFFADNSGWDLRAHISEVAEWLFSGDLEQQRDIATYTMLRIALLSESDVAHYFEVEPATAYARSIKFERRLIESESLRVSVQRFVERVVQALQSD